MAKILIIGAHGKIALLLEPLLVQQGHDVTGVIRNPDHAADVEATGAHALVNDVERLGQSDIDELVDGFDIVVWSAGAGGGDPARTKAVDEEAAIRVLRAAEALGTRLIMVSYFGARLDHGVPSDNSFFAYAEAKAHADDAIRRSPVDWVIVAPSTLTLEPAGGIEIDPRVSLDTGLVPAGEIARSTVARLVAEVIERPGLKRVTLRCNDGETPVGVALDALS